MRSYLRNAVKTLKVLSIVLILALPALSFHQAFASTIFEDGFESGNFSKWSPVSGSPSVTSGNAHHGTYKAVLNAANQYAQARFTGVDHAFMRAYIKFKSFPASGTETTVLGVYNWANSRYMADLRVANVSGTVKWKMRYWNSTIHYSATSEQRKPVLDTWYCVEVEGKSNTTTTAESRVYIDGNELTDISQTGKNNNLPITCGYIWANAAVTRWYDCVIIDSNYIGPEDMPPPIFGTATVNTTQAGTPCSFDCLINDNVNVSSFIFSTNNTGTWANDTAAVFSSFFNSTAAWANVTKTLNDTVGNVVSYMWYANDTSNNWSHSIQYNLTVSAVQHYLTVTSLYGTPSGEGWYDDGSTAYAGLDTDILDHGNGTRRIFLYWSGDASGTDYAQSDPILMDGSKTAIANWKTQYLLTLATNPEGVDSPSGGGWYDADTYASISTIDLVDITPGLGRYKFDGWTTDDMAEIVDASSASTTVFVDKPKTVTANYKTQYNLTVTYTSGGVTDPAGSEWYDTDTTVYVTAYPDLNYVLGRWELDGSPAGADNPYGVVMDSAHTLHAVFEYPPPEYYLTIKTDPLEVTSIPGEGWYVEGTNVELTAPDIVDVSVGIRYKFAYWDVDGTPQGEGVNPITVNMEADHTATAHYILQYYLTVTSLYDSPAPTSEWFDAGTEITDSVTSPWDGSPGTRYVCTGWTGTGSLPASGAETTVTFTINEPSSITWNWKTQYFLTLATNPEGVDSPLGGGWYDADTYASISTTDLVDITPGLSRYKFDGWTTGDVAEITDPSSVSTTVLMDKPKTVTANYKTQCNLTVTYTLGGVTDPVGSEWYDADITVYVTAYPDLDYVLNRWELDDSPVGTENPFGTLMDSAHRLHAVFEYSPPEYYLTVKTDPLGITSIPGEGWYIEGTNVELTAPDIVDVSMGIRYKFAHWNIDGTPQGEGINPITVNMDANHTATAHYTLQYYLTVTSLYDTPTPTSEWFDAGTEITNSVTSPWAGFTGTRYVCTGWTGTGSVPASGAETSVTFTIDEPSSVTWNWKTQHLLNVLTDPDSLSPQPTRDPPGEADPLSGWWFDDSGSVSLTGQSVDNYIFAYWTVDDVSRGEGVNPVDVTMDGPHTAVAHYAPVIHDVMVSSIVTSKSGCTPLPTVGEGFDVEVNVTVANLGDAAEVFNVTLYANTTMIGMQQIALNPAESSVLSFIWDTAGWIKGNYTISGVADTVSGEEATGDNTLVDGFIFVTLAGDIDGDRGVDIFDIVRMAGIYGVSSPNPRYNSNCDVDGDGDIDIFDIVSAAGNYGKGW